MSLFLIVGLPLVFIFILALRWTSERTPNAKNLISICLKGLLCFLPGYLVLAIVRGIAGESLTGFTLYLTLLFRDHLTPFVIASGAFALFQSKIEYPTSDEGIVLAVFSFLSGFFALFGLMDFFARYGDWSASDLFLLPALRISALLILSSVSPRFYRFQGSYALAFMGCAAAVCLPLTLISWIYAVNLTGLSLALGGAALCGAALFFAVRFPELLQPSRAK
jgi:hypothetical protein